MRIAALAAALACAALPAAAADEIAQQLEQGLKLYQGGEVSRAIEEVSFALAQMRQKKAELLAEVFPEAPQGWKASEPESQAGGAALMGGGVSASRGYTQKDGKGRAEVEVVTDSPLIQSVAMILSNPMFLQSGQHGQLVRVNGEKALLKGEGKRAELQAIVNNKALLKAVVRNHDQAAELARSLAQGVDMARLKEMTQ
jgi:hypothetical protein